MSWLASTLVWTGVLLAAVLLLRRPVARHFGPHAAYALWLLPFLRLLLPPIVLPAWLAPAQQTITKAETVLVTTGVPPDASAVSVSAPVLEPVSTSAGATAISYADWLPLIAGLWLTGAAVLLAWRFSAYFRMRGDLLHNARPVGEAGRIRLLESPQVDSPLALGVIDKLIVLPPHFMAMHDRRSRDLALEHEFAHHRANDLLANMLVQPLFALHWFNPLGYYGWRAMRRDQEAACDARVIAARGKAERAVYARLIAAQAAGPRIALAAPMACPVLGDASIVHRLRTLTMTEISRRQRIAGRALIGAAALALPLTASISYAQAELPDVPEVPAMADVSDVSGVPQAPLAPDAPAAYTVDDAFSAPGVSAVSQVGDVPPTPATPATPAVAATPAVPAPPAVPAAPRTGYTVRVNDTASDRTGGTTRHEAREWAWTTSHSEIDKKAIRKQVEREVRAARADVAKARSEAARAHAEAMAEIDRMPEIDTNCVTSGQTATGKNGRRVVQVCTNQIMASAVDGIRSAREEIARDSSIPESARKEVLRSLDREIERLSRKSTRS
ncbi:M56 family metallopeptidase [Tsuneonella suprasediminis]|uniref:M56 family metallopeptidase n=1 Tax=Tsuneonella suprasediminis TaxID=2306996 RepID=A0A419QZ98_9SPHN|nr:M56 family metallopeptidase [Tsuneonella suprasediminis]RJX66312.1 M56 family metallopeptidase [Tsuneonella suprasediminis]